MNFIDKAFRDGLRGDDFLQAMADIYSEHDLREELGKYPGFVKNVILILDYDTAIQMDGLEDVLSGSMEDSFEELVNALKEAGVDEDAELLLRASSLSDTDPENEVIAGQLMVLNDPDRFWDAVREYIDTELDRL